MKKFISLILSAVICVSALSTAVFAEKTENKETAVTEATEEKLDNTMDDGDYSVGEEVDSQNDTADNTMDDENGSLDNTMDDESETAENEDKTEEPKAPAVSKNTSTTLTVTLKMLPVMIVKDSFAVVELCTKDGKVIGEKSEWVGGITESLEFVFDVPEYKLGESFVLKLKKGLTYVKYYEDVYKAEEAIKLDTYVYTDENGTDVTGNTFHLDAYPEYEHAIVVYVEGKQLKLSPRARLIDGNSMVPVRQIAEDMGLEVRYDEAYKSVVCSIGNKQIIFNVGTDYATFFGEDLFMPAPCTVIDGTSYVPARCFAEALGAEVEAIDFGDHIDVLIGESPIVSEYMMQIPVNQWGLSSRTKNLVWIDKSDYRVRVYEGSKGKWRQIKSFPCAIGAPGSPTPTGTYKYEYIMDRWNYDGYYVGPCLVFWGNYAMHSTLLRYNGTPYDDRVGVMISHGCVRLHKADIDWLAYNLPRYSTVHLTE